MRRRHFERVESQIKALVSTPSEGDSAGIRHDPMARDLLLVFASLRKVLMVHRVPADDLVELMDQAERLSNELAELRHRIELRIRRRSSSGTIPSSMSRAATQPAMPAVTEEPPPPLRAAVIDPEAGRYTFVSSRKR